MDKYTIGKVFISIIADELKIAKDTDIILKIKTMSEEDIQGYLVLAKNKIYKNGGGKR